MLKKKLNLQEQPVKRSTPAAVPDYRQRLIKAAGKSAEPKGTHDSATENEEEPGAGEATKTVSFDPQSPIPDYRKSSITTRILRYKELKLKTKLKKSKTLQKRLNCRQGRILKIIQQNIKEYREKRERRVRLKCRQERILKIIKEKIREEKRERLKCRQERILRIIKEKIREEREKRESQVLKPLFPRLFEIKDLQNLLPKSWKCKTDPKIFTNSTFIKHTLDPLGLEYEDVRQKFAATCPTVKITKIERVENPFLWLMYQLKKQECGQFLGSRELQLFHGTATQNLDPICSENFNWRLNVGCLRGKGVYFGYAAVTSMPYCRSGTAMFLARVLFARLTPGSDTHLFPDPNCDATGVETKYLVKFSDYEYYPEYIIHFDK